MSKINLLPWREELRKNKNRIFVILASITLLMSVFLVAGVHFLLSGLEKYEQFSIRNLKREIDEISCQALEIDELQTEKEYLINHFQIVKTLQDKRSFVVRLLDTLAKIAPQGVCFTALNRQGIQITLQGIAETNASISLLLRNLEDINGLFKIKLSEVTTDKKQRGLNFKIEFSERE